MTPPPPSSLAPSTGESHCLANRPLSLRCILLLFPEPLFSSAWAPLSLDITALPRVWPLGACPWFPPVSSLSLPRLFCVTWGCRMGP